MRAVLGSQTSILIALDDQGVVLVWNQGAVRSFAIREDDAISKPFIGLPIAWDWQHVLREAPTGVAGYATRTVAVVVRPDGAAHKVALQILPQFSPSGRLNGCLWLGADAGPAEPTPQPTVARALPGIMRTPIPDDPAQRYPVHLAHLDAWLSRRGDDLGRWRLANAEETRLDDDGMEVCFTLKRRSGSQEICHLLVLVAGGDLVAVTPTAQPGPGDPRARR